MPSHSLLSFVESPDAPAQDVLISNDASFPGFGSSMTPQTTNSEKAVGSPLSCMFCDLTFSHQAELGPHVLTQHPTTFSEPTVLRVEAEFRIPGERPRPKPSSPSHEKEEVHSCIVCGHVCEDAGELETHMRKHKDYFTYCCNVCGRRFREPWFLKNHMKMHGKPGAKNKALLDVEVPVTVNGVVQEPASDPVVTAYKLCMVCGFYFPDLHSLVEHSKVHNRDVEPSKDEEKMERLTSDSITNQETLLRGLNLRPRPAESILQHVRSSKWIPQLDPFNTYQAWQLATKGKVAVGPNITKDVGQDASTDNEDCNSDKEELNAVWSEGQGGDKTVKGGLGRELRSQHQSVTENPAQPQRRSLMQKPRDKERPTTCEECQRTFRTYHQLVLHSRVHKRERGGEESPTSSMEGKLSRGNSLEHAEDVPEDAFEDQALTENLNQGEDGSDRSRIRSKECSYCGKSFRSSYYLTVHLRTHTGEKPYKCAYCDYAAAQKTSLKYHLDRRHKNKPFVEIFCRAEPSAPSPTDVKQESEDGSPAQNPSKLWNPRATPEDKLSSDGQLSKHLLKMNDAESETLFAKSAHSQNGDVLIKCPLPLNMKLEREDIKEENSEAPLNLSLKVSFSVPVSAQPRSALTPVACPLCAYKTMYPEVLIMHHNLTHKDKSDNTKRTGMGAKQQRLTGCPPALQGKDVSPLPMRDRRHPRRTKSPPPPPSKLQEKTATDLPKGPKRPPPLHDTDSHSTQDSSSRFSDNLRKPSAGGKCAPVQPSPTDRVAIAAHRDVTWHSDAARLCLSRGFTTLPQMDFGEPSTKRQKYSAPTVREGDMGEKSGFRGPLVDGSSRLMKPTAQTSGPSTLPDTLVAVKNKPTAVRGGLDTEWTMMNLLHPYTPNDLASLYHRAPAPTPVPGGLSNSRAGGRTVLYQHLPTLPNLQRRDARGLFPNQWHGATDKRT